MTWGSFEFDSFPPDKVNYFLLYTIRYNLLLETCRIYRVLRWGIRDPRLERLFSNVDYSVALSAACKKHRSKDYI